MDRTTALGIAILAAVACGQPEATAPPVEEATTPPVEQPMAPPADEPQGAEKRLQLVQQRTRAGDPAANWGFGKPGEAGYVAPEANAVSLAVEGVDNTTLAVHRVTVAPEENTLEMFLRFNHPWLEQAGFRRVELYWQGESVGRQDLAR